MHNTFKYALGLLLVVGLRLLPHPPNVEPITATLMPYAKRWGSLTGALFGAASVVLYDVITGTLGPWSLLTITGYMLLGLFAGWYFNRESLKHKNSVLTYVGFAVIGTLFYDALTGLTVGPLMFNQPFWEALTGQIPFTLYHLSGNIVLAAVVSPLVYRFVVKNESLETIALLHKLGARA